jgi:hypothetical protein
MDNWEPLVLVLLKRLKSLPADQKARFVEAMTKILKELQ